LVIREAPEADGGCGRQEVRRVRACAAQMNRNDIQKCSTLDVFGIDVGLKQWKLRDNCYPNRISVHSFFLVEPKDGIL
jgi:hypothetical protein